MKIYLVLLFAASLLLLPLAFLAGALTERSYRPRNIVLMVNDGLGGVVPYVSRGDTIYWIDRNHKSFGPITFDPGLSPCKGGQQVVKDGKCTVVLDAGNSYYSYGMVNGVCVHKDCGDPNVPYGTRTTKIFDVDLFDKLLTRLDFVLSPLLHLFWSDSGMSDYSRRDSSSNDRAVTSGPQLKPRTPPADIKVYLTCVNDKLHVNYHGKMGHPDMGDSITWLRNDLPLPGWYVSDASGLTVDASGHKVCDSAPPYTSNNGTTAGTCLLDSYNTSAPPKYNVNDSGGHPFCNATNLPLDGNPYVAP